MTSRAIHGWADHRAWREELAAAVAGSVKRLTSPNEAGLQRAIAELLDSGGYTFEREVVLSPRDRLDFLVMEPEQQRGAAIETKIDGGVSALLRQLSRYTEHDRVTALIVVTTRSRHTNLPSTLGGKPLLCVPLFWSNL